MAPAPALAVRHAGWYRHIQPPLTEASAVGRQHWWTSTAVSMSPAKADLVELPGALLNRVPETLCSAACVDKVELSYLQTEDHGQAWQGA
jgi:hypothetical protein